MGGKRRLVSLALRIVNRIHRLGGKSDGISVHERVKAPLTTNLVTWGAAGGGHCNKCGKAVHVLENVTLVSSAPGKSCRVTWTEGIQRPFQTYA